MKYLITELATTMLQKAYYWVAYLILIYALVPSYGIKFAMIFSLLLTLMLKVNI